MKIVASTNGNPEAKTNQFESNKSIRLINEEKKKKKKKPAFLISRIPTRTSPQKTKFSKFELPKVLVSSQFDLLVHL